MLAVIAQCAIWCCLWAVHTVMATHWHDVLDGKQLPVFATRSFLIIKSIPIVAAIGILIGFQSPITRAQIDKIAFGIILAEMIAISILFVGICYPGAYIMHGLGK